MGFGLLLTRHLGYEIACFLRGRVIAIETFRLRTIRKVELIEITDRVRQTVRESRAAEGFCIVFVPHTTAGVTINENADPSVAQDLIMQLREIAPADDRYRHSEGNSAAHIQASLIGASQTVCIDAGELRLGRWQGIFFCEFDGPRAREVFIQVIGAGR
jgi:secondary thiamine-phosphate synthase enzyme